jgi:predicted nucleic acid binding AN1-type Zn finger protein
MKCNIKDCTNKALKLIGKCNGCNMIFCHVHRYENAHLCLKLIEKKEIELKKLSDKLLGEAVQQNKILKI